MLKRFPAMLAALLTAAALFSQMNRGTLTGSVSDSSGAVIPGARVAITNTATGAAFETRTTESGQYTMPNLPPGSYRIEFTADSFKKLVRENVDLGATQVLRVDVAMEIGQVSESVVVTAEVPRIQSETREVGTSLGSQDMIDLPLSFSGVRSPENFAYKITPGVTGNFWTSHINGSMSFSKEVMLDGASATTQLGGDFTTGFVSVESLGEFKVITSGMSAEFGRSQGGVFNFIMKSGANEPHGSLMGMMRNEALNANSFANNARGVRRPLDRKQVYGGSFGGPVYIPYDGRNRTFFYAAYEGYRERNFGFGSPNRTVPVPEFYPAMINHMTLSFNWLHAPTLSKHVDVDGAAALGIRNLSTFGYPTINWGGGPFIGLTNLGDPQKAINNFLQWGYLNTLSITRGRHFLKLGVDYRTNQLNGQSTQGGGFTFAARGTAIPGETFAGTQTGYSMASFMLGIVDSAALNDPLTLGGRRRYLGLFVQDDFKATSRLTLQLGIRWEYQPPVFEVYDRLSSWSATKIDPVSNLPGAYEFAGNCSGCTGQRYFGKRSLRDWGPRLGFAYRLREKTTLRGGYGIFYAGDLFNGFSPTPLGKPTNVQSGGTFALSADPVNPWGGIFNWDAGFPTSRYQPAFHDVSWGNRNRPGMIDPSYGRTPYIQEWNFNIQNELPGKIVADIGYLANKSTGLWNGNLEQRNQLRPEYLQQFGRNLNNPVRNAAEAAANGIRYPYPGFSGTVASALREFPQVAPNATINNFGAPRGFAHYQSLQVTLNRQFGSNLSLYGNWTWSKNLTNTQSLMTGDNPGPLDYYNLSLEKSLATFDQPHLFKAYVDYRLPFGRGRAIGSGMNRVADALIGNWSVSAILNYFSGTPLGFGASFPLAGGWNGATNRANIAAGEMKAADFKKGDFQLLTPMSPGNTFLNKSLFSDPAPLTLGSSAPRYAQVRGFATRNEDIGIQKNVRFGEKYRFQIRADLLNALNRHTLGGIQTGVTNPQFGQVTGVGGNREVQLGLRFDF